MPSLFLQGPALPIDMKGDRDLLQQLIDQLQSMDQCAAEASPALMEARAALIAAQKAFETGKVTPRYPLIVVNGQLYLEVLEGSDE